MRRATIGAILAGGRSSRMGEPKPLLELGGRTLLERAVAIVAAAGLDPVVVAKPDSELPRVDCRVLVEPAEPRHPLTGIVAALEASAGRGVVALACDMPLVPPGLVSWLAALDDEAAVCEVDGRLEPLLARYPATAAAAVDSALAQGAAAHEVVRSLDPRIVGEAELRRFGDPARIVFNVNTPADLARAEELLLAAKLVP
jgi:molybdopterin-guanine dinucleotide biosynthesis protein A